MTARLWHIQASHYSEKARWALDYKGIAHRRTAPMPMLHQPVALALTRGGQRRFPILQLGRRTVGDSTAIIAALEEHSAERPLYPDDPAERARALELEEFFDEELAPEVRRLGWHHTLDDPAAVAMIALPTAGEGRRRAMSVVVPAVRPLMRRDYGVSAEGAASAERKIRAAMDRIEAELRPSGYLAGDRFGVADLTAASLFTPLLDPPGRQYQPQAAPEGLLALRDEMTRRPGGQWIHEMYAHHRGQSAEVAA